MKLRKCSYGNNYWFFAIILHLLQVPVNGQSLLENSYTLPLNLGAYQSEKISSLSAALRPASGTFMPKKSLGLYVENRFMLKEVSDVQGAVSIPVQSVLFSFSGHHKGTKFISAQSISSSIGIKLSPQLSTGIRISNHWLNIRSFVPSHGIIVEGGMIYQINNKVMWGMQIRKGSNTNKIQKASFDHTEMIGGIGYTLNKQLRITAEIAASSINQLKTAVGLEWLATEHIYFLEG